MSAYTVGAPWVLGTIGTYTAGVFRSELTRTARRVSNKLHRRPTLSLITNEGAPVREISEVLDRWDRGVLEKEFDLAHLRAERKANQHRGDLGLSRSLELRV